MAYSITPVVQSIALTIDFKIINSNHRPYGDQKDLITNEDNYNEGTNVNPTLWSNCQN